MIFSGKYKWLLMDADDTVFDFKKCQHDALWITLENFGITPTEEIIETYNKINIAIWKKLELGQIEKSELVWKRYEELSDFYGFGFDPHRVADMYESNLSKQNTLLDGAYETLKELSEKYPIYIITNGLESVQTGRFSGSIIKQFVTDIFISGKIGYNKPSAGFFDAVGASIEGFDKSRALVIGDSLSSDIKGGVSYGLDTCWLNLQQENKPEGMNITYVINKITELPELLKNIEKTHNKEAVEEVFDAFTKAGIEVKRDYLLGSVSKFKIGGNADLAVFPANKDELSLVLRTADTIGLRSFLAGNTSNLLFSDSGFRGCVVFTEKLKNIEVEGCYITAMAGDSLASLCRIAKEHSLSGLEFAFGIPGSVGGAVCMNAGAYGGQMSDCIVSVDLLDRESGRMFTLDCDDMHFGYRHSLLSENKNLAVCGAKFRLLPGNEAEIGAAMNDYLSRRRSKQPLEYPSAGSVFKRPAPDIYVGKLIEDANLKGYTVGGAAVSQKHAGFIVNIGGATSADVNTLVDYIISKIYEIYEIRLECEIIRVPSGD